MSAWNREADAIAVNRHGKRYVDESKSYKLLGDAVLQQPGAIAYQIFDQGIMVNAADGVPPFDLLSAQQRGLVFEGDTLPALAAKSASMPHNTERGAAMKSANWRFDAGRLILLAVLGMAGAACAQSYPVKPIRLIVPFGAGGGTDLIARTLSQRLSEVLGQSVVVDNRAGAGGVIGADLVAKALPDGYTLVMGTPGPLTINPALAAKMPYTLADFAPIALTTISPFMLVVHPAVPAKSVRELVALAHSKPGALNFGSAGNGSVAHLAGEQFKALAGVQITHVPYKSGGQSLIDLLGGQLQMVIDNLPTVLPQLRLGKLRGLAVGTKIRSVLAPEYPTLHESGVPGYEASTASGMLAPARTPRAVVDRLNRELNAIVLNAEVKERFFAQGLEVAGGTPEQYAQHLRDELQLNARIIKAAGIRLE